MNNEDRELLELAAKAAGLALIPFEQTPMLDVDGQPYWNPLISDGDALRLAVKLYLDITAYPVTEEVGAVQHKHNGVCYGIVNQCFAHAGEDPYAATRRAIVRAAAEIGKQLKGE